MIRDISFSLESVRMIVCPRCKSPHTVKNGKIHTAKQNDRCRDCGRQFVVQDPQNKVIEQATQDLIDKRLLERLPLEGTARVNRDSEL